MLAFLTSGPMFPFSVALGLVIGFLILEIVAAFVGFSFLSSEVDGPKFEFEVDFNTDGPSLALDVDDLNLESSGLEGAADAPGEGLLGWLGVGKVPVVVWAASALTGFGISGFLLQSLVTGALGFALPSALAVPLAVPPAIIFAKALSGHLGRVLPKTESTALTPKQLAGCHGVVSQGTARRGMAAEVRVRDRHSNMHYLRLEPYADDAELAQGTEVYITRMADGTLRLMETEA